MRIFGYQRGSRWQGTRANIVMIAAYADRRAQTGIDIGSNEGLNALALALSGLSVRAVEAREKNHRRAIATSRRLEANVAFENKSITTGDLEKSSDTGISLLLSVHHQIAARIGLDNANEFLRTLAKKSRSQMFFQPACIAAKYGGAAPFDDNDYPAIAKYFRDLVGDEMPFCETVGFAQNDIPKSEAMRPMMIFGREPIRMWPGAKASEILSKITKAL